MKLSTLPPNILQQFISPIVNKPASGENGLRIKQEFINQLVQHDNHPSSCENKKSLEKKPLQSDYT